MTPVRSAAIALFVPDEWLRGRASEGGRDAAGEALADLGDGVVVVKQIEPGPADLVAER